MKWVDIRQNYPSQWLLVEALAAHSEQGRRVLEELAVIDTFDDSTTAWERYRQLHHDAAGREFYILHTDREELDIAERVWLGIRPSQGSRSSLARRRGRNSFRWWARCSSAMASSAAAS